MIAKNAKTYAMAQPMKPSHLTMQESAEKMDMALRKMEECKSRMVAAQNSGDEAGQKKAMADHEKAQQEYWDAKWSGRKAREMMGMKGGM